MTGQHTQIQHVATGYQDRFRHPPDVTAFAPGRVNLLGEHTDYNGGYVLPMALQDLGVAIALGTGGKPGVVQLHSMTLDETANRKVTDDPSGHWSDYVLGCIKAVAASQIAEAGLRATLMTSVPIGAGLSSSAALEVASLRAITALYEIPMKPDQIAVTARAVENDFVGLPCGIMDQFAASVGAPGTALFLNTLTLDYAVAPKPTGYVFVVIDSGVRHRLTDSGYATRVQECNAACAALGVTYLSELTPDDMARISALPDPLSKRARHVVTDNHLAQRGFDALQADDAAQFGYLMNQSHATARDNFEITVPETDALASAARASGALGARQTGGGWGGAVVALVPEDAVAELCAAVTRQFAQARVLAIT